VSFFFFFLLETLLMENRHKKIAIRFFDVNNISPEAAELIIGFFIDFFSRQKCDPSLFPECRAPKIKFP
jgi:hypothetical protein